MRRRTASCWVLALSLAACGGGSSSSSSVPPPPPPPAPTVTVTSPNGGETVAATLATTVRWSATGAVGALDVDLSTDGGATWSLLVGSTPNDGAQVVTLPSTLTTDARVRVGAADGDPSTPTAPFDASDASFRIAPVLEDVGASLAGVEGGDLAWGDVDADGDLDLAVVGYSGSGPPDTSSFANVYLNDAGAFTDAAFGLEPQFQSRAAWGDFDGDGDLDLVVNGFDSPSSTRTVLYRNEGGVLADSGIALPDSVNGTPAWGDFDGDGDLDLALMGTEPNGQTTLIMRNDGAAFADASAGLAGYEFGSLAWGDFDGDGDLDLVVAGQNVPFHETRLYRNQDGAMTEVAVPFGGGIDASLDWGDFDADGDLDLAIVASGSLVVWRNDGGTFAPVPTGTSLFVPDVDWGDFDGDGDLDLVACGFGGAEFELRLLRNDAGTFSDVTGPLSSLRARAVAWGDMDDDGDLDLAVSDAPVGQPYVTRVLRSNRNPSPATRPSAPTGVEVFPFTGGVVVTWDASTGDETPALGLSYDARVREIPSFREVAPGHALDDGTHLLPALGAFRPNEPFQSARFDLPPGVYVVSVHAVDASFRGGPWSEEILFVVP